MFTATETKTEFTISALTRFTAGTLAQTFTPQRIQTTAFVATFTRRSARHRQDARSQRAFATSCDWDEWEHSKQIWGNVFTYTLIENTDLTDASSDLATVADVTIETPSDYAAGRAIVDLEARRDADGTLKIYRLPENDGGGKYEIAGINDRYHPEALADLRAMQPDRRDTYAARYIEEYTLRYTKLDEVRIKHGTRFFVLDTTFNRGPGGSAWIVQDALRSMGCNVRRDGKWGPKTRGTLEKADRETPSLLLQKLRDSRERYEREKVGYRSNFWKGLATRWNKVHEIAEGMNSQSL